MKAPDKIYFPAEGLPSYIDWDGSPIRTKQVEDSDVCYIRKDALIEWLEGMMTKEGATEGFVGGYDFALKDVINKLNSM